MELKAEVQTDDLVTEWLDDQRRKTTKAVYARVVVEFFSIISKKYHEVDEDDVRAFARKINEQSPATQRRKLATVRSFFSYAHRNRYIAYSPATLIKLPDAPRRTDKKSLSSDELVQMIEAAAKTDKMRHPARNALLIQTLYATAGRVSEVLAVRWNDLKAEADGGGRITIVGTKTNTDRFVYVPAVLWDAVIATMPEGVTLRSDERVFKLCRSRMWEIVKQVALLAGMNIDVKVSPHWFRHSHAIHALENGAALNEVRDQLGHASITTTNHYLRAVNTPQTARVLDARVFRKATDAH
jgi:integrase/recombinase XerD